jgi:hypothetical protein
VQHNESKREVYCISFEDFYVSGWAPRYPGVQQLPTLYILQFLLLTPPVYPKKEMEVSRRCDEVMIEDFWTEAEASGCDVVLPLPL